MDDFSLIKNDFTLIKKAMKFLIMAVIIHVKFTTGIHNFIVVVSLIIEHLINYSRDFLHNRIGVYT